MLRALVLAACAAALLAGSSASAADARVAILPIVVHTHEEPGYLRAGLADMLASRLGRSPGLAVLRVDGEGAATSDAATAREAAREADADYVLFGSFTRFGQGASLDVRCLRVGSEDEGDARSIFIQSGTLGEVIPQLDGLAEKVSRYVREGERPGAATAAEAGASPEEGAPRALEDVRSELNALRERVQTLEEQLGPAAGEDATAGAASEGASGEPELASELR